jgi:hypothetical protein
MKTANVYQREKETCPSSREETFERKYDDLGPVEFSKEAIQFGDWLGRNGQNLTADEKAQAVAEYAFI